MVGWLHFQLSWFCSTKAIVCSVSEEFNLGHALLKHNWENIYTKSNSGHWNLCQASPNWAQLHRLSLLENSKFDTLKDTPANPGVRFRQDEEGSILGWRQKSREPAMPLANIPIRKDVAFLPLRAHASSVGVFLVCRQLCCALTIPGLYYTQPVQNRKGPDCYLQTGLSI